MATTTTWYLEERAKKLAIVHLTRRNDLTITETPTDQIGLDLLVSICQNGQYTGRVFGIQIKGIFSYSSNGNSNGTHAAEVHHFLTVPDVPFPLCLFLFAMQSDEGYYAWLAEPILNSSQKLKVNQTPKFKRLTDAELAQIIAQVNHWYDKN